LLHPFFDELRLKTTTLPNGAQLPELFNFTNEEIKSDPDIIDKLIPKWYKK
jgi:glycogen synthase kinase 3 beta